ncbi:lysylphosphatidylglycerol synthase transmembrane domain-containing protein [Sediminibacterium sp.]|uniref:lysylphosphatidylglycerol synthase transmembrane domain-containing protein n=1 Tax=Sediminibacterium sp. TaxID=1917865 RepID=UPI003F723893
MNKKWLSILQYLFFLGLGLFLVWWSMQQIPAEKWDDFKKSLQNANYWLLIPVFVILTTSHAIRALRWKILMKPMGYSPRTPNVFFAVMVGYLANLAVPRLGELLKCTLLAKYEKVPAEKLVGTILVERAFDVISLGIVFIIALISQFDVVGEYAGQIVSPLLNGNKSETSYLKLLIILLLMIFIVVGTWMILKKFPHNKIVTIFKNIIAGIWEGLSSIRKLEQKGLFLLYSVLIWGLYILGTWIGLFATAGTNSLGLAAAVSALAFGSIGMIVTPGGIGAYAYFIAKVLEKNGIGFEIGFANGTLQWFAQFIIVLIVGFMSLGLLPWFNKNQPNNESN